jgi:biopolymer transport protein ExbD
MIARPLDLASKLRPEPRNFDWLFYVNAGLLVLFFSLFGSRYVLTPGFGVDFRLPNVAGANANAKHATHVISVDSSGQILTNDGRRTIQQLEEWLVAEGRSTKDPVLLVRGDANVRSAVIADISSAAQKAGFVMPVLWAAADPSDNKGQKGR